MTNVGYEVNFDGLVGPTHHYVGLSFGNEASTNNRNNLANPKLAAKQGLIKSLGRHGVKTGRDCTTSPPTYPDLTPIRLSW